MFLKKVYNENKFLFYLFSFFCLGQFFFLFKGVETTPFYLYGMYSEKETPQKEYSIFIIEVNDKEFNYDALPAANREMIISSLEHYFALDQNNFYDTILPTVEKRFNGKVSEEKNQIIVSRLTNDSTDKAPYQKWLKNYLAETMKADIKSLKIYNAYFSYEPKLHLQRKELLFETE